MRFGREVYHLLMHTTLIWKPAESENVLSKISRKRNIDIFEKKKKKEHLKLFVLCVIFKKKISQNMKLNLMYWK